MGKSMSTAKQISRNNVVTKKLPKKSSTIHPERNQRDVQKVQSAMTQPSAEYLAKINSMDKSFNDRLKQVYVTSANTNPSMNLPKDRPMPLDRTTPFAISPHTQTTDVKKPDLLLVDDLIELLRNHKENPEKWTLDYIASRFEIPKEKAEKLVVNYSTLEIYYANAPSKSDKYLRREEPVNRLRHDTSVLEAENIVAGKEKKWKTLEEARRDF